jgi:predicted aspartyl protease
LLRANRILGRFYRGVLLVPVELKGSVFKFLVDSGAAYCVVSQKLLDKIIAEPTAEKRLIAPVGKHVVEVQTLRIDNFVVGGITAKNFLVSVHDFPGGLLIDGLLGMDFMGKYRITIETDTQTLILREIPKKKPSQ